MEPRIDYKKLAPGIPEALGVIDRYVRDCGLEAPLLELVKLRASQLNGCARCMQAHARAARKAGITQNRLDLLPAWRESPGYSERERAALGWCEAVTLVTEGHVPDAQVAEARRHFSEKEIANLTLAVAGINAWNRMNIALRAQPDAEE
jgi:AhpD family alkylhydroperoxidase